MVVSASTVHSQSWPEEWEQDFRVRADYLIELHSKRAGGKYGNTFFENEKRAYPMAMFDLLAGNQAPALEMLQREDNLAADNAHTLGIDLYPAFTLKGQVRKYFLFGKDLDPEYLDRMRQAARIWTEQDPHHRPHPQFGKGAGGPGWRPQDRGGWIDVRSTDNLKAMRETSVYLFAEETDNENTRLLYKKRIAAHVAALYHIGMSEWDSENYLGHSIAAFLNLYDFAKDPEVEALAKAALDWYSAAGALKYCWGGFGGPTKRDYGGANVVFGANAARALWPWFGDTPIQDAESEPDTLHVVTSTYRPPAAVVALARKEFKRPVTLYNTKPRYGVFAPVAVDEPMYWETMHFGKTFALGSVVAREPQSDVGVLKLTARNSERGVDFVVANTVAPGKEVRGCPPGKNPGDQVAQHKHLVLWLRHDSKPGTRFVFQVPRSADIEISGESWILRMQEAVVAVLPLGLGRPREIPIAGKRAERYSGEELLVAEAVGEGYHGFGLMAADNGGTRNTFSRLLDSIVLDTTQLSTGHVSLKDGSATSLRIRYNHQNDRPDVIRDGKPVVWDAARDLYRANGTDGPISLGWNTGTLRVQAGEYSLTRTVTPNGTVE
jgi:hypothetical protein